MSERLGVKINGAEVLDRQLSFRVKKEQRGIIALASATDPYLAAEERYRMTEKFLGLILKHQFPVIIITKSTLVLRDLDLLRSIDEQAIHAADLRDKLTRGAVISFSLSTLDDEIAATLEPGAPLPMQRLETMKKCKEAGIKVGVNCIPILPFISDSDDQLELIVSKAKAYGADFIFIGGLTLFGNQPTDSKTLYYKFLQRKYPHLVPDYKSLYRIFFSPPKSYLETLDKKAARICEKYALNRGII